VLSEAVLQVADSHEEEVPREVVDVGSLGEAVVAAEVDSAEAVEAAEVATLHLKVLHNQSSSSQPLLMPVATNLCSKPFLRTRYNFIISYIGAQILPYDVDRE
jgi:hypothetical protein